MIISVIGRDNNLLCTSNIYTNAIPYFLQKQRPKTQNKTADTKFATTNKEGNQHRQKETEQPKEKQLQRGQNKSLTNRGEVRRQQVKWVV